MKPWHGSVVLMRSMIRDTLRDTLVGRGKPIIAQRKRGRTNKQKDVFRQKRAYIIMTKRNPKIKCSNNPLRFTRAPVIHAKNGTVFNCLIKCYTWCNALYLVKSYFMPTEITISFTKELVLNEKLCELLSELFIKPLPSSRKSKRHNVSNVILLHVYHRHRTSKLAAAPVPYTLKKDKHWDFMMKEIMWRAVNF